MCGISGIISAEPINCRDRLNTIHGNLVHRGPDEDGTFFSEHVALLMRRLSIIDLVGGRQPFYSRDRSLALVANGEIYNYFELSARLKSLGHEFSSASDCEIILHLYEHYGTAFIHHLRGMFAFALWDSARGQLFVGRDRIGEKPLYFHHSGNQLIFASEFKARPHDANIMRDNARPSRGNFSSSSDWDIRMSFSSFFGLMSILQLYVEIAVFSAKGPAKS